MSREKLLDVFGDPAVAGKYLDSDASFRALQDLSGDDAARAAAVKRLTPIAERAIRETPSLAKRYAAPAAADAQGMSREKLLDVFGDPAVASKYLDSDASLRALQDLSGDDAARTAAVKRLTPIAEQAIREPPSLAKRYRG
ncbi:MAG: hypothetical protein INH41_28565 [Myxococcaceae bacterium]|nr:hypothetical protein [Myxococcaceae bacterium]